MKKKGAIVSITLLLLGILVYMLFFGTSAAVKSARHFCQCSEEMAKAEIRKNAERLDEAEYKKIQQKQIYCMGGEADPRANLSPNDIAAFELEFLLELKRLCPETARNFGYKID